MGISVNLLEFIFLKINIKKGNQLTIAFWDLLLNLLFVPAEEYLCAGAVCALLALAFLTLIVLPLRPFIFAHSILPVLPIIITFYDIDYLDTWITLEGMLVIKCYGKKE
ncbi:hypothetical protein [Methanohalophilus sp.]